MAGRTAAGLPEAPRGLGDSKTRTCRTSARLVSCGGPRGLSGAVAGPGVFGTAREPGAVARPLLGFCGPWLSPMYRISVPVRSWAARRELMQMAKKTTIIRAAAVAAVAALGLFGPLASPAHGDKVSIGIGINI